METLVFDNSRDTAFYNAYRTMYNIADNGTETNLSLRERAKYLWNVCPLPALHRQFAAKHNLPLDAEAQRVLLTLGNTDRDQYAN